MPTGAGAAARTRARPAARARLRARAVRLADAENADLRKMKETCEARLQQVAERRGAKKGTRTGAGARSHGTLPNSTNDGKGHAGGQ